MIMNQRPRFIGKLRHEVNSLAIEYQRLADEDEAVGRFLLANHRSKHAAYWFVQAMEKILCGKIFQMTPSRDIQACRDRISHHKMDELVDEFVETCLPSRNVDDHVRDHIRGQIKGTVLQGLKFGDFHNNLRYPKFDRYSFSILEVDTAEANFLLGRLEALKNFVQDSRKAWE